MRDERDDPPGPFLWENRDLPPSSCDEQRFYADVKPPPGCMLHSWHVTPIGGLAICWVRIRLSDLAERLAASR